VKEELLRGAEEPSQSGWRTITIQYKGYRNLNRLFRESEGAIVPFEIEGQHNPSQGKDPYFEHAT
jgi:hypothetical protein